ncbi:MAG: tRNA (adenosine(37)-N6)-threonylcarbamoyltransferase complex dimerization subunit type 1 TsaB [Ignavibacteriae bacterium]|nr:tRNA (adenosine(37)-N6)-threonylcarbamoyltransferase complex dimerization subunit type 1 TsaB [Ignavibacteria bacterium]MBI3364839.1 tRNA (adenosine(37)-N6)-threonylcarbamoyltransferase complex dimerization subunit type 1 TsaB [Ignavibacteriota bacterium]
MNVLGIETATAVCGAALAEDGRIVAENWFEAQHTHSEKLVILIDRTLQSCHRTVSQLDAIAVSIGPGSFSGLRIGLSVAKGLAIACNLPIVAVPTLRALALRAITERFVGQQGYILPMIEARRGEVYTALYEMRAESLNEIVAPRAVSASECSTMIPEDDLPVIVMGDGAEKFAEHWPRITIPPREKRLCSAALVAVTGEQLVRRGSIVDTATLEPFYVKEFYTTMKLQHNKVLH